MQRYSEEKSHDCPHSSVSSSVTFILQIRYALFEIYIVTTAAIVSLSKKVLVKNAADIIKFVHLKKNIQFLWNKSAQCGQQLLWMDADYFCQWWNRGL